MSEGKTAQGEPFVTGGVGASEQETLLMQRPGFSLRMRTAANSSGAYLADALIKITDASGKTVLETRADGPWLYVSLKLGEYKVTANYKNQVKQQATRIHAGDHHEILFYFDAAVDRLPKGEKG